MKFNYNIPRFKGGEQTKYIVGLFGSACLRFRKPQLATFNKLCCVKLLRFVQRVRLQVPRYTLLVLTGSSLFPLFSDINHLHIRIWRKGTSFPPLIIAWFYQNESAYWNCEIKKQNLNLPFREPPNTICKFGYGEKR